MSKLVVIGALALALAGVAPAAAQTNTNEAAIARLAAEYGDAYARVCRVKVTRIQREGRTIVRRVRSCSGGDEVRVRREVRTGGDVRVRGGGGGVDVTVGRGGRGERRGD